MLLDLVHWVLGQVLADFGDDAFLHIGVDRTPQICECPRRRNNDQSLSLAFRARPVPWPPATRRTKRCSSSSCPSVSPTPLRRFGICVTWDVLLVLLNPPQDFTSCRAGARPGHPISGLMQCSKKHRYSIISSARVINVCTLSVRSNVSCLVSRP